MAQVERRTAAERREYFRRYHANRKLGKDDARPSEAPQIPFRTLSTLREAPAAHHLRDGSGRLMWPERRATEGPEPWEVTLARG